MNEITLTKNEEKMLVSRFLLPKQDNICSLVLISELGWSEEIFTKTKNLLQSKKFIYTKGIDIRLTYDGEVEARKILMRRLFPETEGGKSF